MNQTRYDKNKSIKGVIPSGYEGSNNSTDFVLPSCEIEDVDRSFFDLFDKVLPFTYKSNKNDNELRKIPVVFSSGERFAAASKKSPLRDKNNSLILPIISISRSGLEQDSTKGGGVSDRYNEMVIKKKITSEDQLFQSLKNTQGFLNIEGPGAGVSNKIKDFYTESGRALQPKLHNGIYEILVIPMPKYFTLKYEVTFWAQYVGQLNSMIGTLLGSYIQPGGRTIKITTSKGYWFVAYFESSISSGNNFDSFSDEERLVKATITAEVPGYLILPQSPGIPNGVKSYLSAPTVSFGVYQSDPGPSIKTPVPSGNNESYLLSEVATEDTLGPSASIGADGKEQSLTTAGSEDFDSSTILSQEKIEESSVGSVAEINSRTKKIVYENDPITGKPGRVVARVTVSIPSKGEEVIRIDNI